jgi:hypothetical protein
MIHPASQPRRDEAPPGRWTCQKPEGAALSAHDVRYLADRGVDLHTAQAAGYWSATRPSEVPDVYSAYFRRQTPALIAPHCSPDRRTVSFQMHPLRPRADSRGRIQKWVSPKAEAAPVILSCHPWTAEEVRNGGGPLWACEGLTRGHALTALGFPAVTYPGCWSWQRGGKPLECWKHTNLTGRLVYLVPDADHTTKEDVQKALTAQVAYLESEGATVLLVRVPEVHGDPDAGLDDYIAAADDPAAAVEVLKRDARPFAPTDVGSERMARSEELQRFVPAKLEEVEALPASGRADCNALKLARHLAGASAPAHGKPKARGVEVHPSFPQMAEAIRVGSYQTVRNALDRLETLGFLEQRRRPRGSRQASTYLLLYPPEGGCAQSVNIEGRSVGGREGQEGRGIEAASHETSLSRRESSPRLHSVHIGVKCAGEGEKVAEKVPALRNSKLVHTFIWRDGKREVVHTDYFKRYGSKSEEILRYVLARGRVEGAKLHSRFGAEASRPGRFFRTWIQPMINDGVLAGGWGGVEMADGWTGALESVRARTNEDEDNRRQSKKYAERRRKYHERRGAERRGEIGPPERTPELAGPETVQEIVAAAEKRDHAARVEEQRRKVGTTVETFLADAIEGNSGFGWRELRALWKAKGGKPEDLRRAVKGPYRFNREGGKGALYVERRMGGPVTVTGPDREPAPVAVLRESENLTKPHISPAAPILPNVRKPEAESSPGDWRSHPLACECGECLSPLPTRYARAWSGA